MWWMYIPAVCAGFVIGFLYGFALARKKQGEK